MLTGTELREALKESLDALFPDQIIYENETPKNFVRPSSLLEMGKRTLTDLTAAQVNVTQDVQVTMFEEVDAYHNSQVQVLEERQLRLMEALAGGYLRVKDRALDISDVAGQVYMDYAEVTFTLTWAEDRRAAEEKPLMEDFHFRINLN